MEEPSKRRAESHSQPCKSDLPVITRKVEQEPTVCVGDLVAVAWGKSGTREYDALVLDLNLAAHRCPVRVRFIGSGHEANVSVARVRQLPAASIVTKSFLPGCHVAISGREGEVVGTVQCVRQSIERSDGTGLWLRILHSKSQEGEWYSAGEVRPMTDDQDTHTHKPVQTVIVDTALADDNTGTHSSLVSSRELFECEFNCGFESHCKTSVEAHEDKCLMKLQMDHITLVNRVRKEINDRNLRQKDLAAEMGCAQSSLSGWLSHKNSPNSRLDKLAQVWLLHTNKDAGTSEEEFVPHAGVEEGTIRWFQHCRTNTNQSAQSKGSLESQNSEHEDLWYSMARTNGLIPENVARPLADSGLSAMQAARVSKERPKDPHVMHWN